MIRKGLALLSLALLPLSVAFLPSGGAPTLPGPGAVLEMHKQLFAALDRGDLDTVREHLGESRLGAAWTPEEGWSGAPGFLAWCSDAERGFASESRESGLRSLLAWAAEGNRNEGAWSTRITRAWTDCASGALSFAALEFARTRTIHGETESVRYRSTSLVSFDGERWVLWLFHVSRA